MSSRMAAIDGESIKVTKTVAIPVSELELRFSRSSGPGGQHAQKSETRVEASFDVEASTGLTGIQAIERVVNALREALKVQRRRRPTKPTAASRERRIQAKRRRGATKQLRRPPED